MKPVVFVDPVLVGEVNEMLRYARFTRAIKKRRFLRCCCKCAKPKSRTKCQGIKCYQTNCPQTNATGTECQ